jgi:hypothetical protein
MEDHPDNIISNLDAFDEGADDVALGCPISSFQPTADHLGKEAELSDHELKGARLLRCIAKRDGVRLELGQPSAQVGDARLELAFVNEALGVAVDEPIDRPPEPADLAFHDVELEPSRSGTGHLQAPLIFRQDARRILEETADFAPHCCVERLDRDQPRITSELAMIPAAVGAAASVITILAAVVMTGEAIAAFLTDKQTA